MTLYVIHPLWQQWRQATPVTHRLLHKGQGSLLCSGVLNHSVRAYCAKLTATLCIIQVTTWLTPLTRDINHSARNTDVKLFHASYFC